MSQRNSTTVLTHAAAGPGNSSEKEADSNPQPSGRALSPSRQKERPIHSRPVGGDSLKAAACGCRSTERRQEFRTTAGCWTGQHRHQGHCFPEDPRAPPPPHHHHFACCVVPDVPFSTAVFSSRLFFQPLHQTFILLVEYSTATITRQQGRVLPAPAEGSAADVEENRRTRDQPWSQTGRRR